MQVACGNLGYRGNVQFLNLLVSFRPIVALAEHLAIAYVGCSVL